LPTQRKEGTCFRGLSSPIKNGGTHIHLERGARKNQAIRPKEGAYAGLTALFSNFVTHVNHNCM